MALTSTATCFNVHGYVQAGRRQHPLAPNATGPPGAKGLLEWFKETREFVVDPAPAADIWRSWAV